VPHFEKIDVGKLQDPKILQEFKLEIKNRFQLLENLSTENTDTIPVNDEWQQIHKIYIEVSEKVLEFKRQRMDNTWNLEIDWWKKSNEQQNMSNTLWEK
jgi:hypothetical protein